MPLSRPGRALLGVLLAALAISAGWFIPAPDAARATGFEALPAADAWVSRQSPDTNYGTARMLRASAGESESVLRFRIADWAGLRVGSLTLTLDGVSGDASGLYVDEATSGWKESEVTWRTRPSAVASLDAASSASATSVSFDVAALFPEGTVDRSSVSLRVRNSSAAAAQFGARESTTAPRLTLVVAAPTVLPAEMEPSADTWADAQEPDKAHGTARSLAVDARPRAEAYVAFNVSDWQTREYSKLQLKINVGTAGGAGVSVYRVAANWSESTLTWNNRPSGGSLIAQLDAPVATGLLTIDISAAYADGLINNRKLALRIVTTSTSGVAFSSRDGAVAPTLLVTPKAPTPTPSPTAPPTASPTVSPSPSPTPSPTAPPTPSPSPTPTATPTVCPTVAPTPTPEPLFYFDGRGTDHGVGMSQQGARGRALAGQTYDQILTFYYTGVSLTTIDGQTPIRVLLGDSFTPSATMPARVTAYFGEWQSAAFPGMTFPQGSYVELWPPTPTPSPSPTASPTASPTPSATATATPTPSPAAALAFQALSQSVVATASPTPLPSASPTASACPTSAPAMALAAVVPTPAATATPTPTPVPSATATPTPIPSASTSPTPTPTPLWVATVYDSLGTVLATAETNDLIVETLDPNGVLEIRHRDELPKYKLYRGQIRMQALSTGVQTINILPLESYLRGVVPAEVPATWPIEAVKTQAVAARTYAWAKLKSLREWDILPTAAHQVYGGYQHEHPNSDAAVLATQNMVLTYKGRVISAVFHANAGGHTENSEFAFVNDRGEPGSVVPYLRGKPDVDENGVPYDGNSGTYAWQSGQFTMSQLSLIMANNSLTNVGEIYNLTFYRGVSGRVYKVILEGSAGTKEVSGGKFKNTYNNFRTPGTPNMVSTLFFLTPAP